MDTPTESWDGFEGLQIRSNPEPGYAGFFKHLAWVFEEVGLLLTVSYGRNAAPYAAP